ncbi:MAG: hypothetical protein GKR87_14515 [Kiritimatiellae bacterium]|nr:hypothetical protein [Kiritimatiellia bacterium]
MPTHARFQTPGAIPDKLSFFCLTWIRQLNAVFCTNHLGQKELQKSLDAPSGCACVFLQPFASKAFAQKSHV